MNKIFYPTLLLSIMTTISWGQSDSLVIGVILMMGTMQLAGLMITFMNIMAIPMIIGIGVDDGVHIVHRYRIEGDGSHRVVFSSTGRAILLTSLTTMIGFGSLWFATLRSLGSLGIALFIGVGACFVATVLVIPVLAGLAGRLNSLYYEGKK